MSITAHDTARIHRLTVAAYRRMGEVGILGPELRTELIGGEIVESTPIGPTHGGTVNFLGNRLKEEIGSGIIVSVQNRLELNEHSEPQPDLMLLRPRADYYRSAHPRPGDVALVIEVADTTLRYDREVKLPLYARAGIPAAWLVDLGAQRLTAYRQPAAAGFQEQVPIDDLARVEIPIAGRVIDLSGLFGRS
jgi:Uma2 family endonuclease